LQQYLHPELWKGRTDGRTDTKSCTTLTTRLPQEKPKSSFAAETLAKLNKNLVQIHE